MKTNKVAAIKIFVFDLIILTPRRRQKDPAKTGFQHFLALPIKHR